MIRMRFTPRGYGGERRDPDRVKRDGWHEQRMLAVSLDDATRYLMVMVGPLRR